MQTRHELQWAPKAQSRSPSEFPLHFMYTPTISLLASRSEPDELPPISGRCERVEAHKWSTDASVLGGGKEKPAGPDLENQEITLRALAAAVLRVLQQKPYDHIARPRRRCQLNLNLTENNKPVYYGIGKSHAGKGV
ncbi:hypothetical protein AFLA_003061 [Aspergillus flavus NRRL3357]|nr:hypothetical protein AFLA_003061 [Aspergillus flavus NRRL3357]